MTDHLLYDFYLIM